MSIRDAEVLARFGHALSDPTRTRLLLALREQPGYPSELAETLGATRQNLSNHLACLRGCGLVVAVPEGRRTRYELADSRIAHALGDLLGIVLAIAPDACATTAATMAERMSAGLLSVTYPADVRGPSEDGSR
jgi:DNA-binding transcriptional ArsR family regulator